MLILFKNIFIIAKNSQVDHRVHLYSCVACTIITIGIVSDACTVNVS